MPRIARKLLSRATIVKLGRRDRCCALGMPLPLLDEEIRPKRRFGLRDRGSRAPNPAARLAFERVNKRVAVRGADHLPRAAPMAEQILLTAADLGEPVHPGQQTGALELSDGDRHGRPARTSPQRRFARRRESTSRRHRPRGSATAAPAAPAGSPRSATLGAAAAADSHCCRPPPRPTRGPWHCRRDDRTVPVRKSSPSAHAGNAAKQAAMRSFPPASGTNLPCQRKITA